MRAPAPAAAPRLVWVALAVVLALAGHLRVQATLQSRLATPLRGDAIDYFSYAYNLKQFGVYSRTPPADPSVAPEPDSLRPPGYPLFLAALTDHPPTAASLLRITMAQALVGVLVTLLAFLVAQRMLGSGWALVTAALTALSPHLINAGLYLLTETVFSLALAAVLLVLTRRDLDRRWGWMVLAGLLVAASALIRGTSTYLPILLAALCFLRWPVRAAWLPAAALVLGFALLYLPWSWRNAQLPGGADPQLQINMLHHGVYPDFTYEGAPDSYGFPYRADPRAHEISASMEAVVREMGRRFGEEPVRHLRWYLLGKPAALWSWRTDMQGMGDVLVYPYQSGVFGATYTLSRHLHGPIVLLAALFCVLAWVPRALRELPAAAALPAQVCAGMLLYVTALHMIGFPLPRYSIPFRPELYLAACGTLHIVTRWIRHSRRPEMAVP